MYLFFLLFITMISFVNAMNFTVVNYHEIELSSLASRSSNVTLTSIASLPNPLPVFSYAGLVNPTAIRQKIINDSIEIENKLAIILRFCTARNTFPRTVSNDISHLEQYLETLNTASFYQFLVSDPANREFREILINHVNQQKALLHAIKSILNPIVANIRLQATDPLTNYFYLIHQRLTNLLRPAEDSLPQSS